VEKWIEDRNVLPAYEGRFTRGSHDGKEDRRMHG